MMEGVEGAGLMEGVGAGPYVKKGHVNKEWLIVLSCTDH